MRAVVITRPGGPEVLEVRQVPDPPFGPEEVLVRIRASAMNRADLLQRRGLYPAPPGSPAEIPGLEMAGEVEACGRSVSLLRPGDRVMAILGGGGHAEKAVAHERLCIPVPQSMTWEEAAAVPEAFLTAFDALFLRGSLAPDETVLLHAAASGVGTAAAQIARATGARVIGLARSQWKRDRLEQMGLEAVLDPAIPDIVERIRRAAGPADRPFAPPPAGAGAAHRGASTAFASDRASSVRPAGWPSEPRSPVDPGPASAAAATLARFGPPVTKEVPAQKMVSGGERSPATVAGDAARPGVDLVIDFLGASSWPLNMEVLATRGRLVLVGTMGGARVEADLSILMRKRLTVVGTVLRSRTTGEKIALVHEFCPRVLPLLADGSIRPVVDRVLPMEEAAGAHRAMERNETFGKIVLRMN